MTGTADRLRDAAFELFAEQGYDATTVDHIAERAGVGRSTFFRLFATKDDVIFPVHDEVLAAIRARFAAATTEHNLLAVTEAARLVLRNYLAEGARARERYRLTRSAPALRHREVASMQRYHQVFRDFVRSWSDAPDEPLVDLRAELMAAAVVTAHNHVLRRWLRGEPAVVADPEGAFDRAMAEVTRAYMRSDTAPAGRTVVVVTATGDADEVADSVRAALRQS